MNKEIKSLTKQMPFEIIDQDYVKRMKQQNMWNKVHEAMKEINEF